MLQSNASRSQRYDPVARLLHWGMAILIVLLIALGLAMTRLPLAPASKLGLYQLHKSLGLMVLALLLVRVLWRLVQRPPPLPATMAPLERAAAAGAHLVLYLLMVALPLSGWLMVSAAEIAIPTRLFGWIPVPHQPSLAAMAAEARRPIEATLKSTHLALALIIAGLALLHALAALRHHIVLGDDVLRRMLPGRAMASVLAAGLFLGAFAILSRLELAPASPKAPPGGEISRVPDRTASVWKVDPAKSRIGFEIVAAGQTVMGGFSGYSIAIDFDPSALERSAIRAQIATGSVSTGNGDIDTSLRDAAWFDSSRHPQATFALDRLERKGTDTYQATGQLELRGVRKAITFPFTLAIEDRRARATALITLDRGAFGVGPLEPIAGMTIPREVKVMLLIDATRDG